MDNTLDIEELEKRIEWLDNERRNDKTIIATLQSKLDNLSTENDALRIRLSETENNITRLNTLTARLEQYDLDLNTIRKDTHRQIEGFRERFEDKERQTDKNKHRIEDLLSSIAMLEKKAQTIEQLSKVVERRKGKESALEKQIEELKTKLDNVESFNEDYKRSLKLIEENRRHDVKRITDLQGEIASLRKRQEETRNNQDLTVINIQRIESRINDLLEAESERREAQTAFLEKVKLAQVERDKIFKEWASRFDTMEGINDELEKELIELENTHRAVKQSQAALENVTERFERRINEITEIQRLNEDRFRQEWTTFKSDDQKRWSNYTLAQEEQHREINKLVESMGERLSNLEELIENIRDNIQQTGKEDIKRMQTLLSSLRESIEHYNNIFKD
jgi:chromosome segregation ATPase